MANSTHFTYRHGAVQHIDYTPTSGDVTAGSGVLLGNTVGLSMGIASVDLTNNEKDALAISGIWEAQVAGAYAVGVTVYKPSGNAILTTTSTNNAKFGYMAEASTGANQTKLVVFDPTLSLETTA